MSKESEVHLFRFNYSLANELDAITSVSETSDLYPFRNRSGAGGMKPDMFWFRGNIRLLDKRLVGFSGSRDCSDEGLSATRDCARQVVEKGMVVVSGGARGVDRTAHLTALEHGGGTIFVIPQGIGTFRLTQDYASCFDPERVLILSMFSPGNVWSITSAFLRNRLIVSLSDSVIIAESNDTGGTIYTGRYALDHTKRKIYIVRYNDMVTKAKGNKILLDKGGGELLYLAKAKSVDLDDFFKEVI